MTNKELLALARNLMVKANEKMAMAAMARKAASKALKGHENAMIMKADDLKAQAKVLREQSLQYQRQITREDAKR